MIVTCPACQHSYDDARCTMICPHEAFLTEAQAQRKDLAASMVGKNIAFADGGPQAPRRIQSIDWDGFITLAGGPAHHRYNPNIFKVIEP
jgi:hypothetical protein